MIEFYDFGQIVIAGKKYVSDVIIFPDRIRDNWWRKSGHQLYVEDIRDVIEEKPQVLVVGTGYSGFLKILPETESYLESLGIELIAERTDKACKTYNNLFKSRRVIAALHLTC
ncbi:hypothetical protein KEJ26_03345 [Candidatus Bathyarchaeota archaeon]|nr:hypothetical protein [Candidatus Bathyarchaeota archaeon]